MENFLRTNWPTILIGIGYFLLLIIAFYKIDWEKPSFSTNWIWYILLALLGILGYIFAHYFYSTIAQQNQTLAVDFLKVLLPTILAILSLIYALSSGLFNIKNETLQKNKANLQYEINEFEKKQRIASDELKSLEDSIHSRQVQLELKTKEVDKKEKEIESFQKEIEEIKKESIEKEKAIEELTELNQEFDKQLKIRLKNIEKPIVEIVNVDLEPSSLHIKVSVYDSNMKLLTNKDIALLNNDEMSMPSKGFDEKTGMFNYSPHIYAGLSLSGKWKQHLFGLTIVGKVVDTSVNYRGYDDSYHKTISLPYMSAEYRIILNDFK
ncbi:hypothetical protein [Maribacter halichondriae]|uniref:hypothetical protein n=1 Tax=Maribacter halichondriae TaxID=2980554 RepID=UPI00235A2DF2|nr:hypothetical protein [Maribacter sp. Hal144]